MHLYRGKTDFEEAIIRDAEERERPDFRAELAEHMRTEGKRIGAELKTDRRAAEPTTCDLCNGPIAAGDRIVTMPTDRQPDAVWHRSCLWMGSSKAIDTSRLRRAHQKRLEREREADPRQGRLF